MSEPLPALCLIAVPGRRRRTIELSQETERRGYAGIYVPSPFGNMSMCEALSWNTSSVTFGTAIAPIYQRTIVDFAQSAAMMHEVSGGRFRLGIGIAHGPSHVRMGVTPGKPLADTRAFIEKFRAEESFGPLPPIIVAALRKRMVALSGELAQGVVFANASLSHMGQSLAALPAAKRNDADFFIGNMIPTCISDDVEAAKAVTGARSPTTRSCRITGTTGRKPATSRKWTRSRRPSRRDAATTWRNIFPTNGWRTTRCSDRRRRCARASPPGAPRACTRRSWCPPRRPATR